MSEISGVLLCSLALQSWHCVFHSAYDAKHHVAHCLASILRFWQVDNVSCCYFYIALHSLLPSWVLKIVNMHMRGQVITKPLQSADLAKFAC